MMRPDARLFRLLLRLYPSPFRDEYGEEMTEFFLQRLGRARAHRARPALAAAHLWARTVVDVVRTAAAERVSAFRQERPITEDDPMSSFLQDLRYAGRRLRRTPLFTLAAVAMLAIGIGLNAVVFNLVDAILLRPPPFENPAEIVHIYQDSDEGAPSSTSFPAYREMAEMGDVFAGVAATSSSGATWDRGDVPQQVSVEYATASYFPVLGLRPSRGRWFDAAHDQVGTEMVAVVSHHTWRTQMGANPDVVGSTIRLNNQLVTIIGVGPAEFNGEAGALRTDFWLSISSTPVGGPFQVANLDRRQDHWYQVMARLRPGVTEARAQIAMDVLAHRLAADFPELNAGRDITVFTLDEVRFHPDVDGGVRGASMGLFAVAALVLLLACTNLATLLLVRGISRGPEMAVREALGAGRQRVVRLLLLEALLLSAIGGAAGLALAAWAVTLIPLLPLPIPGGGPDVGLDLRMIGFGVLLMLATGLIFGLLPAVRSARTGVAAMLRDEGSGRSAGRRVSVLRSGLVALQVALSMVLVVGAGLLARSLANARDVDAGVDVGRIALIGTNLQQGGVTGDEMPVVVDQLLARVEAMPGVERAAITTRLPAQPGGSTTQVVEGYEPAAGTGSVELPFAYVSRGYFATMGIDLIAGRTFEAYDRPDSPPAIVVNETAARLFFGGEAVGGHIRPQGSEGAWQEVVGVVSDVSVNGLQEAPTPMIYYSAEQAGVGQFTLVARTAGDPAALLGALRAAVREVRPTLPVTRLLTLDAHMGDSLAGLRAAVAFMGAFSLLALMLASLGVYAVVSFTVGRRTQELGIRVALGAPRARIVGMIVGESLIVVALGLAVGLALSVLATRGLTAMLYGVGALDEVTFAGAAALLLLAAGTAAFVPARRAAGANPVEVLRSQ